MAEDPTLEKLIQEFAASGIGDDLYTELVETVKRHIRARRYPERFSPTGRWDQDAITGLVHDWAAEKLLRLGHLEHLLLANTTIAGLKVGLELSFRHFLLGSRKKSELDHLFRRAAAILSNDDRFEIVAHARTTAATVWGLATWSTWRPPFMGAERELIAAGWRLHEFAAVRYREGARKSSHILSDPDLARFLQRLLEEVGQPLSLAQIVLVFRYRFNLLEAPDVSLDEDYDDDERSGLRRMPSLLERLSDASDVERLAIVQELASEVVKEMPPRRQAVVLASMEKGMTLVRIAERLKCSKSTVDNEIRRTIASIKERTTDADEANEVYGEVLALLRER